MKILIISDVHAHYHALEQLAPELAAADQVLCLGDIVGYHAAVNEAIDYLKALPNLICVLGNHDHYLLNGCPQYLSDHVRAGIGLADRVIRPENRAWLARLPISWAGFLDGRSFLLAHGSPWRPFTDYLYADSPLLNELGGFHYDVICFGQTHRVLIRMDKKPFLINPGSVGQSRDKKNIVSAYLLETETMAGEVIERALT